MLCSAVEQDDSPGQQQIDNLHAKFVGVIEQLYHDHRHLIGWDNRPLKIV